jgi:DNA-binding protein H-NS
MAKATRLSSLSVDALLQLRDDIGKVLTQKADSLREQLSRMGGDVSKIMKKGRRGQLAGRKVPIKFRDKLGNTWAGRGAQPVWLREQLKAGAKIEDFAVATAIKVVPKKKSKTRRKGKR